MRQKTPKIAKFPKIKTEPKAVYKNSSFFTWSFQILDFEGAFGWKNCQCPDKFKEILKKKKDFESMSLQNWREQGCHNIALDKLSKSALKRLKELHLDDIDELYSIHITGKERIFCIKMNNVMKVLWWDPLHKVCPSKLKHT